MISEETNKNSGYFKTLHPIKDIKNIEELMGMVQKTTPKESFPCNISNQPCEVTVLETNGAKFAILTCELTYAQISIMLPLGLSPKQIASIGAMVSRSYDSMLTRTLIAIFGPQAIKGITKAYTGYGHGSIGDMAGPIIFSVRGLSMLAAQLFIDFPRFNGQEASSRYIDLGTMEKCGQSYLDPEVLSWGMNFYNGLNSDVKKIFIAQGIDEKLARPMAFDVSGGFLPFGTPTSVFFSVNARDINHLVNNSASSAFGEVKCLGIELHKILSFLYPDIITNLEPNTRDNDNYNLFKKEMENIMLLQKGEFSISGEKEWHSKKLIAEAFSSSSQCGLNWKAQAMTGIHLHFKGLIDFRSLRDIARHRTICMYIDYLTALLNISTLTFEEEYLNDLPTEELKDRAHAYIEKCRVTSEERESILSLPMGTKMPMGMDGPLNAWFYFALLRSGSKVHQTVITFALEVIKFLNEQGYSIEARAEKTDYGARQKDSKARGIG